MDGTIVRARFASALIRLTTDFALPDGEQDVTRPAGRGFPAGLFFFRRRLPPGARAAYVVLQIRKPRVSPSREPIFNLPRVVLALALLLAAIHGVRVLLL